MEPDAALAQAVLAALDALGKLQDLDRVQMRAGGHFGVLVRDTLRSYPVIRTSLGFEHERREHCGTYRGTGCGRAQASSARGVRQQGRRTAGGRSGAPPGA